MAIETNIPPEAWRAEDFRTIATATEILQERADEMKRASRRH